MISDADVFDKRMRAHGGRLKSPDNSLLARVIQNCKHRASGNLDVIRRTYPKLPSIYFDVFDSYDANAFAFKEGPRYFIGISRGIIATFGLMFERILGDRRLLRSIGYPDSERDDLPSVLLGPNFAKSVVSVDLFGRPVDELRLAVAERMMVLALDFIFSHEFAHIGNGHLDYWEAEYGITEIQELSGIKAPDAADFHWFRQAIEMDADRTAVMMTLSSEIGKVRGLSAYRPGLLLRGINH